jgi:hypothetical protein
MWCVNILRWLLRLVVIGLLVVDLAGVSVMLERRHARLKKQALISTPTSTWSTDSDQAISISQLEDALVVSSSLWLAGALVELGAHVAGACVRRWLVVIVVPISINVALETGLFAQSGFAPDVLPFEYSRLIAVWLIAIIYTIYITMISRRELRAQLLGAHAAASGGAGDAESTGAVAGAPLQVSSTLPTSTETLVPGMRSGSSGYEGGPSSEGSSHSQEMSTQLELALPPAEWLHYLHCCSSPVPLRAPANVSCLVW